MQKWQKKMHPIELTERRIDNVMKMMSHFEEGSWGYNYWGSVLGYLLRKLNGEVNERTTVRCSDQTRYRTH